MTRDLAPRKQPRQVRAELTRQRILQAAAHVFATHGYAAGTTNRIAEQARVSIGSLYQYYPNKDAILAELLVRHLDAGMTATRRLQSARLPARMEDILRVFVRATIENHADDPQLLRVLAEQAPRSPELIATAARNERENVAHLRDLLDRHPENRVADTATAARLMVATIEQVVHRLTSDPDPIDRRAFENELVAMLTRYVTRGD